MRDQKRVDARVALKRCPSFRRLREGQLATLPPTGSVDRRRLALDLFLVENEIKRIDFTKSLETVFEVGYDAARIHLSAYLRGTSGREATTVLDTIIGFPESEPLSGSSRPGSAVPDAVARRPSDRQSLDALEARLRGMLAAAAFLRDHGAAEASLDELATLSDIALGAGAAFPER